MRKLIVNIISSILAMILTPLLSFLLSFAYPNPYYAKSYIYDDDILTMLNKLKISIIFALMEIKNK